MTFSFTRHGVAAALAAVLCAAVPVAAQERAPESTGAAPSARLNPADAKATVPRAIYRSAFQGYRPHADTEVGSWVEANDTVGRIGGWRVYAKEAAAPETAAPAAQTPAARASGPVQSPPDAKPPASGHHGHKH